MAKKQFNLFIMLLWISLASLNTAQTTKNDLNLPKKISVPSANLFVLEETNLVSSASIKQSFEYIDDLNKINSSLSNNQFSTSIFFLEDLIAKIKLHQVSEIQMLFPLDFKNFKKVSQYKSFQNKISIDEESYGVMYSDSYLHENGGKIDFSVIFSDPSIKEYSNVVKQPTLVDTLNNTNLIKVDGYPTLFSQSEEQQLFEMNVIMSEQLMVSVVSYGVTDNEILINLLEYVELSTLENYLKQ